MLCCAIKSLNFNVKTFRRISISILFYRAPILACYFVTAEIAMNTKFEVTIDIIRWDHYWEASCHA